MNGERTGGSDRDARWDLAAWWNRAGEKKHPIRRNRILYGGLFLGVFFAAIMYGDPFTFMTLYALIAMPAISALFAVVTLYGIGVSQDTKGAVVVKGEPNTYFINFKNRTKIGFGTMRCVFLGEHFAVETDAENLQVDIQPFMEPVSFPIDFTVKYRGTYQLGLQNLEILDFLGLFKIRRRLSIDFEVIVYPRIMDLEHMQLAIHVLSKAPANLAMAQEDYADYTDVRPYEPSDPIKKIHWKLTAKRGEWIVKNYQSSTLNSMAVLLDANKRMLPYETGVKMEDSMVEHAVAVLRYCLRQQMPVDLLFGRNVRESGRHIGDFNALYNVMATLSFAKDDFTVNDALDGYLNETSRNVNVVILTSLLDMTLYDRILNAVRFGHYIAVMYFIPEKYVSDKASDAIFERLEASGLNCVKI